MCCFNRFTTGINEVFHEFKCLHFLFLCAFFRLAYYENEIKANDPNG